MKENNEFSKQINDDFDELNEAIIEAQRKAQAISRKLFETAPLHDSSATIQECAEHLGWIDMCLNFEVNKHLCKAVSLFGKVE